MRIAIYAAIVVLASAAVGLADCKSGNCSVRVNVVNTAAAVKVNTGSAKVNVNDDRVKVKVRRKHRDHRCSCKGCHCRAK